MQILVPFPLATDDHQTKNAEAMVAAGASVLLRQADLDAPALGWLVAELLAEVMGDDAPEPGVIGQHTRFAEDLEMESLEFVVFAEKVKERYGDRVDFVAWLSGKTLDEVLRLRLGDLADFIDESLRQQ